MVKVEPVKRGRGRPRKNPIKLKMAKTNFKMPKRKRGRPKKPDKIPFNFSCGRCDQRARYPYEIVNHSQEEHVDLNPIMMYWDEESRKWKCFGTSVDTQINAVNVGRPEQDHIVID